VLVIGLAVAILLMAVAANFIAAALVHYPWITWIGLLIIVWVALDMIYSGSREVACAGWKGVWCAPDLPTLIRGLAR
jgi:predicted tellurium resistance membrane protein TerC